jgi:O-methyltransferase
MERAPAPKLHLVRACAKILAREGVYTEFGCHEVNTFRFALNALGWYRKGQYRPPNKISHFYAFDSFEGMPEPIGLDQQKIWRKGMNFTSLDKFKAICKSDLHRITIVPGFFSDSLPAVKWNGDHKIALAYIDVDYYSSAKEALAFITDKLQHGSIVAFDDWNCYYADPMRGERRAFSEWQESLSAVARFEPFLPISWSGQSFIYQEIDKLAKITL